MLALLCLTVVSAWATGDDIVVTPTANANAWTFTMPGSDVELEGEYYTDLKEDEGIDHTAFDCTTAGIWLCRTLKTGSYKTFASPVAIDGEASGIGEIENGKLKIENGVYDLSGRRMESSIFNVQSSMLKKGVYIVNGRKDVVC